MFRVLISATLFLLAFSACSKADHQAAGSRIPSPGLDHLSQVYAMVDAGEPNPLALSFLSSFEETFPNGKQYISRPASKVAAEESLRAWSARSMDFFVVSGKHSLQAFYESKISWANSKRIIVISDKAASSLDASTQKRTTSLIFEPGLLSKWGKDYCGSNPWNECQNSGADSIFTSLVDVSWNWSTFLNAAATGYQNAYRFSFKDGFLTLKLKPTLKPESDLFKRLDHWIRAQALAGLSGS